MSAQQAVRHLLGASAGGVAAWLAGRTGIALDPGVIVALGLGVYATVEKAAKQFTSEPDPVTNGRVNAMQRELDELGKEVIDLKKRLPALCDVEKAGRPCVNTLGHDGPHTWETP